MAQRKSASSKSNVTRVAKTATKGRKAPGSKTGVNRQKPAKGNPAAAQPEVPATPTHVAKPVGPGIV